MSIVKYTYNYIFLDTLIIYTVCDPGFYLGIFFFKFFNLWLRYSVMRVTITCIAVFTIVLKHGIKVQAHQTFYIYFAWKKNVYTFFRTLTFESIEYYTALCVQQRYIQIFWKLYILNVYYINVTALEFGRKKMAIYKKKYEI